MNPKRNGKLEAMLDEAIRRSSPMSRSTAAGLISAWLDVVAERALAGEEVRLPKFGTFYRGTTKARRIAGGMRGMGSKEIGARFALRFRAAGARKGAANVEPSLPRWGLCEGNGETSS